jgi:hypothetical protein
MSIMAGLLGGISSSLQDHTMKVAKENERRSMLESKVYEALLASPHPEIQQYAMQGMADLASGKNKGASIIDKIIPKQPESPGIAAIPGMLQQLSGGGQASGEGEKQPSAAMPATSAVEPGGEPPKGIYPTPGEQEADVFRGRSGARAEFLRELGASDEQILQAFTGGSPAAPRVMGDYLVSPTGEVLFQVPPGDTTPKPPGVRTVSPGGYMVDETGKVLFRAPDRPPKGGKDPIASCAPRTNPGCRLRWIKCWRPAGSRP